MEHRKTALITGASRGLGRALALELARDGWSLVLVARGVKALQEAANAATKEGADVLTIVADVGRPALAHEIAARALARFDRIDLIVHNASDLGPTPMPLLADTTPEALTRVFEVNTLGPFRLTRALIGQMLLGEGGLVVQISSDAAVESYPHWGAYGASKAASDHLTRTWSAELEGTGIRFVAIDPGEMDTQMHAQALPDADPAALADPHDVAVQLLERLRRPTPTVRATLDREEASR